METLEQIKQSGMAPNEFWYLSTMILTGILVIFIGILIVFVKGFFSELKETIDDLKKNIQTLTEIVGIHKIEIQNNKDDIVELKKRRR